MQIISEKQIKNLPVEGKGGNKIGRVIGIEIEPESQSIINYLVKPRQVVKGIFEGNLVINREQVIELNKERLIVDDSMLSGQHNKPEPIPMAN